MATADLATQYAALTGAAGLVDLSDRTQIEITGADRASFLQNMGTADIGRLAGGNGCETFLTDIQAKILAHLFVFCGDDSLVLETVPGQAQAIGEHLEHYVIREDVQIRDRTDAWCEVLLAGAESETLLKSLTGDPLPAELLAHSRTSLTRTPVSVCRVDWTGQSGYLIRCEAAAHDALVEALTTAGATPCGDNAFQAARIEAGTPLYGKDITHDNLPQEVDRNDRTISFTKGCYLGQETVARIDSLGHVNQLLTGVRFDAADVPNPGTELTTEGKVVGRVTSAAMSPKLDAPLALAYVRREHNHPGTRLSSSAGEAEVVSLPV